MSEQTSTEVRIFDVETRFQTMARRPGGISRDAAIEEANASIELMKPGFDEWAAGELHELSQAIERARSAAPTEEWLEAASVHARAVRDVGTTMGSELLTFVADSLCEILEAIEAGSGWDAETLVCHLDALMLVRQPAYRGMGPLELPELTRGLRRLAERISTAQSYT
jgi:hypothetical protein